jgi:SAM-dependent methyltransferase
MSALSCRLCSTSLTDPVIDLGATPLANSYLSSEDLEQPEQYFPLKAYVCGACTLLQLEAVASPDVLFSNYAYFSSYSQTLLEHSERFAEGAIARLGLAPGDQVIEVASNDGYLLQFFQKRGLNVLGVEPARNVAAEAAKRGIPTVSQFFCADLARELAQTVGLARLLIANNVIAHVPELNDFLDGLRRLLAPDGTLSIECHHALALVEQAQFDNLYHEHFQYFSLTSLRRALCAHGLTVIDVDELPTQGGSIRVLARHAGATASLPLPAVEAMLARETRAGLSKPETFQELAGRIASIRLGLLGFLTEARAAGKTVVCFGAAAKGNTLLNYCGVGATLVEYAVDSSPHKQGRFLPGSRIPVFAPERIAETRPDYVLILPWNLADEISAQMASIRDWGGRFVVAVPDLRVLS